MRKWVASGAALGLLALLLAPVTVASCSGDPCPSACANENKLNCAGTCDCSACDTAPASCHDFFDCVASHSDCTSILFDCNEPSECAAYVSAHCQ